MKKSFFLFGLITLGASLLLFSCGNREAAKAEGNIAPANAAIETNTGSVVLPADSSIQLTDSTLAKDPAKENEENEKEEKK
jgi:hypothetical protein